MDPTELMRSKGVMGNSNIIERIVQVEDKEKMKEFELSHPNLGTASNAFKELKDSVENNGIFISYLNYS